MSSFPIIPKNSQDARFASSVSDAVAQLSKQHQELQAHVVALKKQAPVSGNTTIDISKLTPKQLKQLAKMLQPELLSGGSAPIHTEQLLGTLAQPQLAGVPIFATNPPSSDPSAQDGALVLVGSNPTTAQLMRWDGSSVDPPVLRNVAGGGGGGGLTSVGITIPSDIFNTTNNPLVANGFINISEVTQGANTFWCGPTTGVATTPTFRKLVAQDFPLGAPRAKSSIPSAPVSRDVSILGEGALFGFVTDADVSIGSHINFVGAQMQLQAIGVLNITSNAFVNFRLRTLTGNLELAKWTIPFAPMNANSIWIINATLFVTTSGATGQVEVHGKIASSPVGGVGGLQQADAVSLDLHSSAPGPVGPIDLTVQQILNWTAEVTVAGTGTISQRYAQWIYLN